MSSMRTSEKIYSTIFIIFVAIMILVPIFALISSGIKNEADSKATCRRFGADYEYRPNSSGNPDMCVNPKTGEGKYI
jgi:ABC-type glycerol-3-phosphate transport system permease component